MLKLTVLEPEEIEAMHQATLRVLAETGMVLTHAEGREMLAANGGRVQGERVYLPEPLVEAMLARCVGQVRLRGRSGQIKTLGGGELHWHNLGGARDVYDPSSGKRRQAVLQDVRDSTRLLDALEGATTITPFFTPVDVPGALMSLAMYRHALPNTTKPLQGPGVQTAEEVRLALRMAAVIGPPQEVVSLSVSPVSPLTFPDEAVGAILAIARAGVAFAPLPCPTAGTTAPLSLAGSLVQQSAEVLASLVLAQLAKPGLPMIYCGRLAMMEPRTGISVWGGVELALASAATVQLGHHYGLPVNVYGFSTNAHTLDVQNGFERALNAAIPALAGADELSGIGEMEAGVMGSYAQMVCDSELAASVRRLKRGFGVDEDALGVAVIAAAMDGTRNFLSQKHTRQYLRAGELLLTALAERHTWETWDREGRQGMAERAQAQAEHLLAEHEVPDLSPDQETELDAIMEEAASLLVRN
ncbi:MAG: trimethylamine methyltransferase family protein [Chloroflexota bacterium]